MTTTGPDSSKPVLHPAVQERRPERGDAYSLGNGSVTVDQRSVIDGGFQELVRLGELPATDADVQNSLAVLDKQIAVTTPTGTGYYRYGIDAAHGSTDGYGDCYVPDPTDCPKNGQPWPTTDNGSGHLWPVLSGERAETALATGDTAARPARSCRSCSARPPASAWCPSRRGRTRTCRPTRTAPTRRRPRSASRTGTPPARPRR